MKLDSIETTFEAICALAAAETLPRFKQHTAISNKLNEGFDPVTEADQQAEKAITAYLNSEFPDHGVIGEEFGKENTDRAFQWVIDPIDGTRSFISGVPLWGTLIGLMENDRPIAGVMDQPFIGERFWSDGTQSFYQHKGEKSEIRTSSTNALENAILMATTPDMFKGSDMQRYRALENAVKLSRYGTDCYAYCLLASGHIDLVCEASLALYDIAALIPIVEHAGGVITDWQGNPNPAGGQVLAAANEALHKQALKKLAG